MIKLLIADDRDVYRDSLKGFLYKFSDIYVIEEVSDGQEALDLIGEQDFDVVLMDIHMPFMNGIEATRNILKYKPDTKILGSSFDVMPDYVKEILAAGALGFISKDESGTSFIEAIKIVENGGRFLSDEVEHEVYHSSTDSFF